MLRAPPGAGKTTRVPPALLIGGAVGTGRIVMLQSRRLAARTSARRIAAEQGWNLGDEVGYQIRFESRFGKRTRILVVTEGILLRLLMDDPFLEGTDAVIFDEFHERNLYSDISLAMVRRVQQSVRPELKIIVMSATLDPGPIAEYLGGAPAVDSPGRTFPVEIRHARGGDRRRLEERVADGVADLLDRTGGDILVFLPGAAEIHRAARQIEETCGTRHFDLMMLHGELPAEEQDRVLSPSPRRKVILSTNVAETSVTIDGVTGVVDSGLAKVLRFDPAAGLDRLETEPISKASADQRAGRAGRTGPGVCLRLWEETSQRSRPEFTDPEIRRADLAGPILQLLAWGEPEPYSFPWYEAPRTDSIDRSLLLLRRLGALDADGHVTAEGRRLARLPVHPRIGRLLLEGERFGVARDAAWLAALLSERDPFFRGGSPRSGGGPPVVASRRSHSDVLDRLAALQEAQAHGTDEFPWGTLNRGAARFILRARDQLLRTLDEEGNHSRSPVSPDPEFALQRALLAAFPDRLARRRDRGSDRGLMVGGKGVRLAPQSAVRHEELFLCVDVDAGTTDAVVRQASAVERNWLPQTLLHERTEVFFHPSLKQVQARKRLYYEDLVLGESPTALPDNDEPGEILFQEALRALPQVLTKDESYENLLHRLDSLKRWMPELDLPAIADASAGTELVLQSLCRSCRSFDELKKADWAKELQSLFPWQQWQLIETYAPEKLKVPSGSMIALTYEAGRPPVLAVRIQEIFGLRETPRIAGGRVSVLLHLLAPNMRPQQVTDDLASFWRNTYPEVRKELARRYPKHPWPEDPLTAIPLRK